MLVIRRRPLLPDGQRVFRKCYDPALMGFTSRRLISELHVREFTEERENALSPLAARSVATRGRMRPEVPCPIRSAFQRDRDRIIHCNAFRRLKHKTQVFIAPQGDHYVTRLTHTLEVSQIARTIARALNLNEDLTEAIALGHDLGHTPFGHIGEEVLDDMSASGFRHNEQSLRVVDVLENDGHGLNLTWEVRDGILRHSKSTAGVLQDWGEVGTVEGEVVRVADFVAYVNHDIDDALRAGTISQADLPESTLTALGASHSARINTMVSDVITSSWNIRTGGVVTAPAISMGRDVVTATEQLRQFLFERVYDVQSARREATKARNVLKELYRYLQSAPANLVPAGLSPESRDRYVLDYLAGMTDQYALRLARAASRAGYPHERGRPR
jgi:dGTPase